MPAMTIFVNDELYTQLKELSGDSNKGISSVVTGLLTRALKDVDTTKGNDVLEAIYLNNIYTSVKGLNELRKKRLEGGLEG